MTGKRFLLLTEVAEELRAPLSSVRDWIRLGKLRASRPGKRVLVERRNLDNFVQKSVLVPGAGEGL